VLGSVPCEEDAEVAHRIDRRLGRRVEFRARLVIAHTGLGRDGGEPERSSKHQAFRPRRIIEKELPADGRSRGVDPHIEADGRVR
jgi:hypothetical protein